MDCGSRCHECNRESVSNPPTDGRRRRADYSCNALGHRTIVYPRSQTKVCKGPQKEDRDLLARHPGGKRTSLLRPGSDLRRSFRSDSNGSNSAIDSPLPSVYSRPNQKKLNHISRLRAQQQPAHSARAIPCWRILPGSRDAYLSFPF